MNNINLNYTKAGIDFKLKDKKTGTELSIREFIKKMRQTRGEQVDIEIINNLPTRIYSSKGN